MWVVGCLESIDSLYLSPSHDRINAEAMGQYGGSPELVKMWSLLFISTSACLDALCAEATRMAADTRGAAGRAAGERCCNRQMLATEKLRPWREGPLGQVSSVRWRLCAGVVGCRWWDRLTDALPNPPPTTQRLVARLLSFYEREGDVQTLATIVCVLNVRHPYTLLQVGHGWLSALRS